VKRFRSCARARPTMMRLALLAGVLVCLAAPAFAAASRSAAGHSTAGNRRGVSHARRHRTREARLKLDNVRIVRPARSGRPGRSGTTGSGSGAPSPGATSPASGTAPSGGGAGTTAAAGDTKTVCVYAQENISILQQFDELAGRDVRCAMVFNDASSTWAQWDTPWFIGQTYTDENWRTWATAAGTDRQLVITQNLFPSSEDSADWLQEGADGDFEGYARTLAANLVAAGLGSSVIRLAHEANGTWYPDSIPDTAAGDAEWVQFWRNTVIAMRSVPGANFRFDWTVNAGYRDIPLGDFYPGNDVVDIIGVDAYDDGISSQTDRWQTLDSEPVGVAAVAAFAAAHDKPLSIPEWGIDPSISTSEQGGGDDPGYVDGIAGVVAGNDVAYQSYFFSGTEAMQLLNSPQSIAAYRAGFGADGTAVTAADRGAQTLVAPSTPSLALTGGPPFGSTVGSGTVSFDFTPAAGFTPTCRLDGGAWSACTSTTGDVLTGLSPGFHWWSVEVQDAYDAETQISTDFVVP
jgi:Glycosyl hydrolase family 26